MSLDYAILGFLNTTPLSGYDLKKQFDSTIQHFWTADQSQIYRVLSRLKRNEMVTQEVIEQDDRPDRKVYHITGKGKKALTAWLQSDVVFPPMRYGPMIQVFFGAELSDEELVKIFEKQSINMRKKLQELDELPGQCPPDMDKRTEREKYMCNLTLEASRKQAETRLAFAEEVIDRLKKGKFPPNEK